MKIFILSDINWWGWSADLNALEEFVEEEQPNLIILAGDLVNAGGPLSGWRSIQNFLSFVDEHRIHTFLIRGNWDETNHYARMMKKFVSSVYVQDISDRLVIFGGISFLGVPYSTTTDLQLIRSLKSRLHDPVDFVIAHAELKRRVWLFELNPKVFISGHSDVQLCQIRKTVFISIDSFPRHYAVINYDPPTSEVVYYQDHFMVDRKLPHYLSIDINGEGKIKSVNRKHFALRVGFTENGQLHNISKAPRYFRRAGKPNYSRIIEDLLSGKESIESNSEKKADVISKLQCKGISEKWVQEYFAKPKI